MAVHSVLIKAPGIKGRDYHKLILITAQHQHYANIRHPAIHR
jgi:hypothetical protein